VSFLFQLAG